MLLVRKCVSAYEDVPLSISIQDVASSLFNIPSSEINQAPAHFSAETRRTFLYITDPTKREGQGGQDAMWSATISATTSFMMSGRGWANRKTHLVCPPECFRLTFTRDGQDLVITTNGTGQQLRVVDSLPDAAGLVTAFQDFDTRSRYQIRRRNDLGSSDIAKAVGLNLRPTNGNLIGTGDVDYLYAGNGTTYMSAATAATSISSAGATARRRSRTRKAGSGWPRRIS